VALPSPTTPTDVLNIALVETGSRVLINNLATDTSAQAITGRILYTPKTQALLRGAHWDFARAQATLTVWKAAIVNGVTSSNPPPQPWLYSYLYPADCLKCRFVLPTIPVSPAGTPLTTTPVNMARSPPVPTGIPFVPGTDFDQNGNLIRVVLCNLPNAQLVYTRDLSQSPLAWDPLFLSAETAFLATFLINANARNSSQYKDAVSAVAGILDMARVANGNEGINNTDHTPDWLRARFTSGAGWYYAQGGPGGYGYGGAGYDGVVCGGGEFF
jgi:hypothetical protein